MRITKPQTVTNVAIAQIESLRKQPRTTYWHSDQWFDNLADYSNDYDGGNIFNVCGEFRKWENEIPNRRNVEKWRTFISRLVESGGTKNKVSAPQQEQIPAVLKAALLEHLDALLEKSFRKECQWSFSKSRDWKFMRDISAASCFLNSFSQACNYGH